MHFHPYIYAVLIWRSSWDNSQTDHRQVTSLCHSSVEKWVDCWDVILSYPIQRWKNSVYRYRARAIQGTNIYRDSTTQTHKTATTNQAGIFSCSFQFLLSAAQILLKIWKNNTQMRVGEDYSSSETWPLWMYSTMDTAVNHCWHWKHHHNTSQRCGSFT